MSGALSKTAASDAAQKNGGHAEAPRQGKQAMDSVVQARSSGNGTAAISSGMSEHRKLAIWLDKLVEEAKAKKKPVAQMTKLTPALAGVLLDRNPGNRKISQRTVERFAYEIKGDRWTFNGEPILISDTGQLNDGQHRCSAVVEAGKAVDVILIVGVPRDSRTTLDQGRTRAAADYLSMNGEVNTIALAAAANYAWQYRNRGMLALGGTSKATKSEVLQFVSDNPGLAKSVAVFSVGSARALGGVAFLGFCHFAISAAARAEDVDRFFIALVEGVNLGVGSPILYVRNRLQQLVGDRDQNGKAELIFKAWNAWRRGEKVTSYVRVSGGVLPVLEA